jgi:homoserine kinase
MSSTMAEASAPASSANLGPCFDCLALALELRCHVTAQPAEAWSVDHAGDHGPESESDDAVLAAARLAVGGERPLHLTVSNEIPIGRGLGSSAAAMAASALAAWRAVGEDHSHERLFDLVAEMEGHPDNAAAAVFGGLALVDTRGVPHRVAWNPLFSPLLLIPSESFATRDARNVLPATYPRSSVVASVSRTASLIAGLLSGDSDLLRAAGGDEVHEAPRNAFVPGVAKRINAALDAGAVHAAWSGAGPTVLAIVETADRQRVADHLVSMLGDTVEVAALDVAVRGAV